MGELVLQFRALCFGLSTAPQAFTLVMVPVSSIMHRQGFQILRYLDDWLVLGSSYREIERARDFLLWLCHQLGIQINIPKSSLTPTQSLDYLGMTIRTVPLRVFLTLKRFQKLSSPLQSFLSDNLHPLSVWRQLLGVMSSVSAVVPGARLCMRSLQLWLNVAGCSLLEDTFSSGTTLACRIFGGGPTFPSAGGSSSRLSATNPVSVHGYLGFGLGCVSRRRPTVRLVVTGLLQLFDQPPGAVGGSLRCPGFPPQFSGPGCCSLRRQHHGAGIPEEAGRHPLSGPQLGGSGHPSFVRGPSHSAACLSLFRAS